MPAAWGFIALESRALTVEETDDELLFADEEHEPQQLGAKQPPPWKILVVDDEPEVHAISRLALTGLEVRGRGVELISAFSAAEARQQFATHNDIALVLLDVVMESEDAGLQMIQWIRTQHDPMVRVVLRTGQPGRAPERRVMLDYDIHDYRAKTELTAARLVTTVVGGLRAFSDLMTVQQQKRGLEKVIAATGSLFERRSMADLISGLLIQLSSLLDSRKGSVFVLGGKPGTPVEIQAGTGCYEGSVGKPVEEVVSREICEDICRAIRERRPMVRDDYFVYAFASSDATASAVCIDGHDGMSAWDERLVEMFCQNAAIALDNQRLHTEQVRLLGAVSRFVPTTLLNLVGQNDVTQVDVGDHIQRPMTTLFADLRGFTALAERMSSRQSFCMINDLFGELVPWIYEHHGVVDKYLGDGLMALFPRHSSDAVRAAVAMLDAVRTFNLKQGGRLPAPVQLSLGIHTGDVILGMVGSASRLDTTVMSDSVNLAARIERLTRKIAADLLITEQVYEDLSPELQAQSRFLGKLQVRGKQQPVGVYEVVAADPPHIRDAKMAIADELIEVGAMIADQRWWSARDQLYRLCDRAKDDVVIQGLLDECTRQLWRAEQGSR